jgi:predicted O-methyltransferase YrrM
LDHLTVAGYADQLFDSEDNLLRDMRERAVANGLPTIQVPMEVGRLLQLQIVQSRARRILEIGTLFGYSTVLMARALLEGGHITSLEANPKHAQMAMKNMEAAGVAGVVDIVEGPAAVSLRGLAGQEFDLVFIDADKDSYEDYLTHAIELTHPGSWIVADNVWRRGEVTDPGADDLASQGIQRFNRALAAHESLISTLVPTREGEDALSVSVVR